MGAWHICMPSDIRGMPDAVATHCKPPLTKSQSVVAEHMVVPVTAGVHDPCMHAGFGLVAIERLQMSPATHWSS